MRRRCASLGRGRALPACRMDDAVRRGPTSPPARHTPVRTCVGCRGRDEQHVLLRVVARRDEATGRWILRPDERRRGSGRDEATARWILVPDVRRRGAGRGAYVHPDPQCLQTAIARRAFGRALRLPAGAEVDVTRVQERLQQQS